MLEPFFFVLGLVNSILLIFIFVIRKNRLGFLQRFGWLYLLLAIPAAYGVFLVFQELKALRDRNLDEASFEEKQDIVSKLGIKVYPSEDLRTNEGGLPTKP